MAFNGKYKLQSSEHFEEYMKAIGVPEALIAAGSDPNAETSIHSDNESDYVITLTGSGRTIELKFTVGEEFEETTPHGIKVKCIVTKEGDKLVQKQSGAIETVTTREIDGDDLKVTLVSGAVTSVRIYKRI